MPWNQHTLLVQPGCLAGGGLALPAASSPLPVQGAAGRGHSSQQLRPFRHAASRRGVEWLVSPARGCCVTAACSQTATITDASIAQADAVHAHAARRPCCSSGSIFSFAPISADRKRDPRRGGRANAIALQVTTSSVPGPARRGVSSSSRDVDEPPAAAPPPRAAAAAHAPLRLPSCPRCRQADKPLRARRRRSRRIDHVL